MSFEQLGLSAEILKAIDDQGYTEPSPIQLQAIPPILEGKDIMGCAQTGTGKTAGFTLPMLRLLQPNANTSTSPARHPIRALILVPTRELAAQVHESVKTYGKYLALRSTVVYGGVNIDQQIKELHAGIEILVATPGRLLDHVQQQTISLSKVEILVLDEADRMLDMGFLPDIKRILMLMPSTRQSLMFSATFSPEIKKLADKLLNQPVLVEIANRNTTSELVAHVVHPVKKEKKGDLLVQLLKLHNLKQVLVFVRTKQGTSLLTRKLQREGITTTEIHGDKNQLQRTQALEDFKQGVAQVLVATDVAARGLDIEDLPYVINYELPNTPEDYVHRIGRTGRAGTKGNAISLVSEDEKELLADIEKLLKRKLLIEVIPGFEPEKAPKPALARDIRNTEKNKDNPDQEQKRSRSYDDTKPNGAQRLNPRVNRNSYGDSRRNRKPDDPIFTQPYVPPLASSNDTAIVEAEHHSGDRSHQRAYGQPKRQLPALFSPPVADKDKHKNNE
ncbi:MAG: DEAD/DEAH box helicase [Nitrosomonas sp.]|nr:DEAD/DEAH box helicase [Nitrosomonas sp.]MDP1950655.1 DEAD/DEAH box helicase [Nitrosomonas sp.]